MKYQKKPVVVEAFQMTEEHYWNKNNNWPEWLLKAWQKNPGTEGALWDDRNDLFINTLEGILRVSFGDWIIRGVKGELYPCKPDIFEETYKKVGASSVRQAFIDHRKIMEDTTRLQRATVIFDERDRQDEQWGEQDHSLPEWLAILMEEVGELATAIQNVIFHNDKHRDKAWREEAVQVAAVALAMLEQYQGEG